VVGQGFSDSLNVTVANLGSYAETFKVTVYANKTSITSQNITLSIGNVATITLVWDTTNFPKGRFDVWAQVALTSGETNTANNTFNYGTVKVTIPGDVGGFGVVGLKDLGIITGHWKQTVPPAPANADPMNVGIIGLKDLGVVTGHWKDHV
jgi:hypothetical protein